MASQPEKIYEISNSLEQQVAHLLPSKAKFVHYTSLAGFYGITESARLRFTSAKSTNDPSEFLFGESVVTKALEDLLSEESGDDLIIIRNCLAIFPSRKFQPFVFCMSEVMDAEEENVGELSQWRLYGSDGRGIALVFNVESTAMLTKLQNFASLPRRVVYGEEDGIALVKSEVKDFLVKVATISHEIDLTDGLKQQEMGQLLGNKVFWLPSVIKHKAYKHEREVRLIRGDIGEHVGNPLVFFEKNGVQRPSIERSISELLGSPPNQYHSSPISKVIVGPSSDQAAIEDSINHFLSARNWTVPVVRSNIPYRVF
ncbi:DUF2971 domain-containing protein [Sphingomonas mali]|uniref:DUF2971 domain-containing protein n=1 Tax=Sphingomonas mali TaxID=40682 RepID=UPI000B1287A1|nr:DUF2971 domain-containing protein [Sphingomonas mali]